MDTGTSTFLNMPKAWLCHRISLYEWHRPGAYANSMQSRVFFPESQFVRKEIGCYKSVERRGTLTGSPILRMP